MANKPEAGFLGEGRKAREKVVQEGEELRAVSRVAPTHWSTACEVSPVLRAYPK